MTEKDSVHANNLKINYFASNIKLIKYMLSIFSQLNKLTILGIKSVSIG